MPRDRIITSDSTLIPRKDEKDIFSAWKISFFGAIGLIIFLAIYSPDPYTRILLFIPDGILVTFQVTIKEIRQRILPSLDDEFA